MTISDLSAGNKLRCDARNYSKPKPGTQDLCTLIDHCGTFGHFQTDVDHLDFYLDKTIIVVQGSDSYLLT